MKNRQFAFWFMIALFAAVGAVSWRVYFRNYIQHDTISIHIFPKTIGQWTSEEIPISDDEKDLLETDNVFVRRYTNPGNEEVFLFIVYSQNNRKVSHPPEICYTGGGATILSRQKDAIPAQADSQDVTVQRLKIERGQLMQIFAYWFKVGNTFTTSYWKQQIMIALNSFLGSPSSSALIRISSTVQNGDDDGAVDRIKRFGRQILPYLNQYLP